MYSHGRMCSHSSVCSLYTGRCVELGSGVVHDARWAISPLSPESKNARAHARRAHARKCRGNPHECPQAQLLAFRPPFPAVALLQRH